MECNEAALMKLRVLLKNLSLTCLLFASLLLVRVLNEALTLQHLPHVLVLQQDLQGDDHQHQLRLLNLEVEAVQERHPNHYERNKDHDDEDHEHGNAPLHVEAELVLNGFP